jgi:NAD(P)-dependent dehydrogenase (short-subunit alcohol dehydrogenase family)
MVVVEEIREMAEKRLEGRVALVSGGASGIGRATVLALAREGAAVAVVDRDERNAGQVASEVEETGGKAAAFALELTDTAAIAPVVERVLAAFGRIDLLVNAAGIYGERATILEVDVEDWDRVHAVNLKAPMLLMQAVARHMLERGGGGRIVNVSSSSAFRGMASPAPYGTSKAGLVQLTRSAAAELAPYDINVNAVAPGLTATPLTSSIGGEEAHQDAVESGPLANLFQRVSLPEDVAETIVFLCLPASRQITAQTLHTSAGSVL